MKALLLIWLALLVCGCARHEVRCDGHLERINAPVATSPATSAAGTHSLPGVR